MKKLLLYCILFFLSQSVYSQVTITIEILADGNSLTTDADAIQAEDVEWSVTNKASHCVVHQDEAYQKGTFLGGGTQAGMTLLMIDMNIFDDCRTANEGDTLLFDMKVTNSASKYYGYTAKRFYLVPAGSIEDIFVGKDAINFIGAPEININISPLAGLNFCQGASSGTVLTASVENAEAGYTITWEGNGAAIPGLSASGTTADFKNVTPGTYSVVAKVGNASSAAVTVVVKPVPQKPQLAKVPTTNVCAGDEVNVNIQNVETGVTYTWSPSPKSTSAGGATFTVAKNTNYNVTPELDGCPGPKSADITFGFKPDLTVGTPTYQCYITEYEAYVPVPGVVSVYTSADADPGSLAGDVQMNVGEQQLEFLAQSNGTHTYWIKGENFCGTKEVVLNKNCTCDASLAMSGGGTFCEGDPKNIVIKLTATSEFKKWSFDLKDPEGTVVMSVVDQQVDRSWTYTPTKSGQYTIENFVAKNSSGKGCGEVMGSPLTVRIDPKPTVSLQISSQEDCFGRPLTLTATPGTAGVAYKYIWTGPGAAGQNMAAVTTTFAKGKNSYSVKIQDPTTSCYSDETAAQEVTGHHVTVSINGPASVANGATANLTAVTVQDPNDNGAAITSYEWQGTGGFTGASAGDALTTVETGKLTQPADYSLTVTDHFGCTFKSADKRINVSGSALAVEARGASDCQGKELTLACTPSGGEGNGDASKYTYLWEPQGALVLTDPTAQNPKVDVTTPVGKYKAKVTVTDVGTGNKVPSAEVEVEVKAVPELTNLTATPNSHVNSGFSTLDVTVTPDSAQLAWSPINLIASGGNSKTATTKELTADQTFTVRASLNGCFAEKAVDVTVSTTDMKVTAEGSEGCAGTALTVEAKVQGGAPKYDFLWGSSTPAGVVLNNPSVQKPTIQNTASLRPGTYSIPVTVTDAKGKSKQANAVVTIFGLVEAQVTNKCNPDQVTFDSEIKCDGGKEPYMIYSDAGATIVAPEAVWDATGKVATLAGLESGKGYSYYIKDQNGCNIKRVDLAADCSCGAQLVMIPGEGACATSGDDIDIILQASGGDAYSFDLVNVELGTVVLPVRNDAVNSEWRYPVRYADRGKYRIERFVAVTAGSPDGCEGNVTPKELEIKFFETPQVEAGEDQLICGTEQQVTLKANGSSGLTYTWDKGVEDGVPFTPPMGVPTVYTVTGVDDNGCSKTDQVTISAHPKPHVSAMVSPNVVCKGKPVTLSSNGDAHEYEWNNGGVEGDGNIPETTTRYIVKGTNTTTGCSDTASALVVVNLPAEIVERPKDRTIAIGKDVTYKVTAIGNNLSYEWQWQGKSGDTWSTFTDNTTTSPKVSGATTETLVLEQVPQAWDGRKIKCIVKGDCGEPMEAVANLWVKECFDIVADLHMLEGIRPDEDPESEVDGWYCKGNRIALKASVELADPENGAVANPHYTWTIDGLPAEKVIESDSSVLSWVPAYYEDDIVVKVCVYSDGACNEACSRHLRLKARTPDDVKLQIVTSADPERKFCPGERIDFTVAMKNEGYNPTIHWYRDIFDKGTGRQVTFEMDQKDTWVKAVFEPSPEMCVEKTISDSVFLQVKEYVHPTLRIENNIGDTIACQGDTLLFHAIWTDAGEEPELRWQQDIWPRGNGEYALISLTDKDSWVECTLKPGKDVCFDEEMLRDTMVIRVRETGSVTISADMEGKQPGDELVFISEVENMKGSWGYSWYVNHNLTSCEEEDYVTDVLKQGDVVQCAINGDQVCQTKVFSNELTVNYLSAINRDTMIYIYKDEVVRDLDMAKPSDLAADILFMVEIPARYGTSTFSPEGKFNYTPVPGFVGTDYVKYRILNRLDKTVIAEGYIYITVREENRFRIPNIITPNADGLNDTWKLDFLSEYPNHMITIFNRYGQPVFESQSYQNDWDGTGLTKSGYVGHINLPNGIYTYVIDLGDKNKTILKSWIEIRANMNRRDYR